MVLVYHLIIAFSLLYYKYDSRRDFFFDVVQRAANGGKIECVYTIHRKKKKNKAKTQKFFYLFVLIFSFVHSASSN